jgi:starvation-inducible DNA-binding protein
MVSAASMAMRVVVRTVTQLSNTPADGCDGFTRALLKATHASAVASLDRRAARARFAPAEARHPMDMYGRIACSTERMFKSPSHLSEHARINVAQTLNARLADGLDLHGQIKVAHWNIRGPQFASLHPLFESFAVSLANHNDTIAERAVTLGARAYGTVRHVASTSRLPEYPQATTRDTEHVKLLADRIELYLQGLRESRGVAENHGDPDSADVFTQIITEFEKHAWFLRASLES